MAKNVIPAALTDDQIKEIESRLAVLSVYSFSRVSIASLCAMARERNALVAAQTAQQKAAVTAVYGLQV